MKKMKKMMAVLVAACMMIATCTTAFAAENTSWKNYDYSQYTSNWSGGNGSSGAGDTSSWSWGSGSGSGWSWGNGSGWSWGTGDNTGGSGDGSL